MVFKTAKHFSHINPLQPFFLKAENSITSKHSVGTEICIFKKGTSGIVDTSHTSENISLSVSTKSCYMIFWLFFLTNINAGSDHQGPNRSTATATHFANIKRISERSNESSFLKLELVYENTVDKLFKAKAFHCHWAGILKLFGKVQSFCFQQHCLDMNHSILPDNLMKASPPLYETVTVRKTEGIEI